jgi:hypothetical protein
MAGLTTAFTRRYALRIGPRPLSTMVLVAAALIGCGCGGGSASQSSTSATSANTGVPNGEAGKPAGRILADVKAALSRVHSFHMQGTGVDLKTGPMSLTGDIVLPGRIRMAISQGDQTAAFILISTDAYLRGNTAFWAAHTHSARVVNLLANRWIQVPSAVAAADFGPFLAFTKRSTLAGCLIGRHGTLTVAGTTIDGMHPVVILKDHGDTPGDSPGQAYIATTGPPLPLRAVQTGPSRPGGHPDRACGERSTRKDTTQSSNITLSGYNQPIQITAPPDALILPRRGSATA